MKSPSPNVFNYTGSVRLLVADIISAEPIFSHVRLDEIGVGFSTTRTSQKSGVLAKVVPLRFENGTREGVLRGRRYFMPHYHLDGRDLLYLMMFYLPRFQDLPVEEKLRTIFHELYHISPSFNGDIRRFPGPNFAHGQSREWYNGLFEAELQSFQKTRLNPQRHPWLSWNTGELQNRYAQLVGHRFPNPKLVPAEGRYASRNLVLKVATGKTSALGGE